MESRPDRCFYVKSYYLGLIYQNISNTNKKLWKLKIPLKIKIFLWYLKWGVILTEDNLARRNWQGSQQYCFCHEDETIQHLFFDCHFIRLVWTSVYTAWGLPNPSSVTNMFGNWLIGTLKDYKPLVLVGAAALCWSVWRCRNAVVFYKKKVFFLANYFYDYTFATNTGYPTTAFFAEYPCSDISFFGAGGQGIFCPGSWVAV